MTVSITHNKVSTIPDDPTSAAAGEVVPSDWNANHVITGLATVASTGAYADLTGTPANADTATTGLLTATDWNTFNGKGSGSVTGIVAGPGLSIIGGVSGGTISTFGTLYVADTGVSATTYGNSTKTNVITVNSRGQITNIVANDIGIPATSIISGTLASARISGNYANLTGVGTLTNGTWNATTIDVTHGGTGTTGFSTGYVKGNGTSALSAVPNIPSSDITGLGSMSTQSASSVTISGGTITGLFVPLPVTSGGIGVQTITGYVKGNGTSAMTGSATIPTTDLSGTITNAQLANPAITINGSSTALGGSVSVGTVTSVTATAPVASTGGTDPVISMPAANTTTSGYLTATDWNTFNSKGAGTVTSVTATSPVTSTGGATPVIAMPAATTSVNGYLTSTDWNTFNNKQPAGSYLTAITASAPLSGSGTAGSPLVIATANTSTTGALTSTDWNTFNGKQAALVSATNIKTINGNSLLGSGDLAVSTSAGGSNTQVQFNSGGAFAGSANLTFDGTTLAAGGLSGPHNGTVGATTPNTGAFTKVSVSAGTSSIAPINLTAGTNLTTAAAGAIEYDGSAFYNSIAASTRGVMPSEQMVILNTAYTLTSQTAAQKLFNASSTGALTLPVGTYQFECFYALTSMSSSSGSFGFALAGTAVLGSQGWWSLAQKGTATLATATATQSTYNTAANTALVTASTNTTGYAFIKGVFKVTTTGTIIPSVSLGVAAAAVVGINSYFKVSPLSGTSAANITVGNWS